MDGARLVIAQFCDDIRHEVGNKFSLMGCYGDDMVFDKLPAVAPKLCAQIRVITPADRPFTRLIMRARINDDILAELEMPISSLAESFQLKAGTTETGRVSLVAMMVFSPLAVSEPCKIRIEAETEDGIILGSGLSIRERTPEDPPVTS